MSTIPTSAIDKIKRELGELDYETLDLDGTRLKPSQCYHFDTDPVHLLFNTNCPHNLKERITAIVKKYIPLYESSAPR